MTGKAVRKELKPHYTPEQERYARECSALEYAQSRGYELIRKGNYYQMKDHDSMVFTASGRWFWNSRSLFGGAGDFIVHYEGKTWVEAVLILNHAEGQTYEDVKNGRLPQQSHQQPARAPRPAPAPVEKVPFELPVQSNDFRRLFGYLCGTRKLDRDILHELIQQKSLYESVYLVKWRQIAEGAAQLPTTGTYSIQPGNSVGRVHYLNDRCEVVSTTDYDDRAAFQHEVRRCLSIGQRIVAETPEQQARIHRDRAPRAPAQAQPPLEPEDEMEL